MPATGATIHPTAIIADGAVIGEGTSIGPYSIIGPKVVLGKSNRIGPHAVIEGNTRLGDGNNIFQFASIGSAPQDLKFKGEDSVLEIGNGNTIREYVTLQPGTAGGGMLTKIGSSNLFMANCHVGHDSTIGDNNVFANSAAVAGHVVVGSGVILGGMAGVHQFVRLGDLCFLGAGSMVTKDIPPFCIAQGDRAHLFGINKIALARRGVSAADIQKLRALYRELFSTKGRFEDRIQSLQQSYADLRQAGELLEFIKSSKRGITFPRHGRESEEES